MDQVWDRGSKEEVRIVVWVWMERGGLLLLLLLVLCCWRSLAKRGVMLPPPRADFIRSERSV